MTLMRSVFINLIFSLSVILISADLQRHAEQTLENRTSALDEMASRAAAADTVFYQITAGETLILALPDSLKGHAVESWHLLTPPALSQMLDSSFMWKTRPGDRGTHMLHFEGSASVTVDDFVVTRVELWTANVRII